MRYRISLKFQEWRSETVIVSAKDVDAAMDKAVDLVQEEYGAEGIIIGDVKPITPKTRNKTIQKARGEM